MLIIADFGAASPGAFIRCLTALGEIVVLKGGQISFLFPTKHDYHCLLEQYGPVFICNNWARGKRFNLALIRFAMNICHERQINIVHTQFGLAAPLCGCILALTSGTRHVWHWNSPARFQVAGRRLMRRYLAKTFYRLLDLLTAKHIAVSNDICQGNISDGITPADHIEVIHNAIDLAKCQQLDANSRSLIAEKIGHDLGEAPILGMVANFGPAKDHDTLLEALTQVKKHFPSVLLLLIGEGMAADRTGPMARIRARAKELGLEKNVVFTGQVDPVAPIIGCLDIGILVSRWEGFGNVVVEYMAMGKPVVASRVGGIPEIVEEGVTGFLVGPGNPFELADRIIKLLEDKAQRTRMGEAGRDRAKKYFALDRWAEKIFQVYCQG